MIGSWAFALPVALLVAALVAGSIASVRARTRDEEAFSGLAVLVRAEEALWRPVFWAGCHEYQQHEDGRRRAVRLVPGEDMLCDDWLGIGERVTK